MIITSGVNLVNTNTPSADDSDQATCQPYKLNSETMYALSLRESNANAQ